MTQSLKFLWRSLRVQSKYIFNVQYQVMPSHTPTNPINAAIPVHRNIPKTYLEHEERASHIYASENRAFQIFLPSEKKSNFSSKFYQW